MLGKKWYCLCIIMDFETWDEKKRQEYAQLKLSVNIRVIIDTHIKKLNKS